MSVDDEMKEDNADNNLRPKKVSQGRTLGEQPVRRPSESEDVISQTLGTMGALNPKQNMEVEKILRKSSSNSVNYDVLQK